MSVAIPDEYQADDITLKFSQDAVPITLSTEDVSKLGPEQLSAYFREYVSHLGGVLMAAGQNPTGPEAENVNTLTAELVGASVLREGFLRGLSLSLSHTHTHCVVCEVEM